MSDTDLEDRARALYAWNARIQLLAAYDRVCAELAETQAERDEWKRRANEAAATLGYNRKATQEAGRQVVELRAALAEKHAWGHQVAARLAEQMFPDTPGCGMAECRGCRACGWTTDAAPQADEHGAGGEHHG